MGTALKEAEANLWLHSKIVEQMTEGVCLVRVSDGLIVYTTPAFDRLFAYEQGELEGQPLSVTLKAGGSDLRKAVRAISQGLRERGEWAGELYSVRKSGMPFWCSARVSILNHPDFGVVWLALCEDITGRKAAEQDRDRFFNLSIDLLCFIGTDEVFKRLNPAFEKTLGYASDELTQRPLIDFIHPDDQKATKAELAALRAGQPASYFENRFRCKDSHYRWLAWHVYPVAEDNVFYAIAHDITANKASEAAYVDLVDQSLQGVLVFQEGGTVFANPAIARTTGYTVEELLALNDFTVLIHPEDMPRVFDNMQRRFAGEAAPSEYEYRLICKNGEVRWIEQLSTMISFQGKPAIQTSVIDITERKQAEEKLKRSEMQLAEAQRIARLGNWEWDLHSNIVMWSDELLRMFAGERDGASLSFEDYLESVHPYDRDNVYRMVQDAIARCKPFDFYHRAYQADGSLCIIHERGQVVSDEDGRPVKLLGTVQDVTRERQAEAALAEQHNLLRTLIDTLPDFIYVKDTECRYILSNIANAHQLGTVPDQMVGKWDFDFFPAETAERLYADDQIIIRTGQPMLRREDMGIGQDGEPIWMLITKAPLHDQDGNIIGLVGINRDITINKQVQQQIESARQRAEEASQLKSQFLANMSHELRTPLNAIIGFSDMLLKNILGEVSDTQREYIRDILSNGEHLLAIINDVLDISKIEAGQFDLNNEPLDVSQLLDHIWRRLQSLAQAKNLSFTTFFDPALPTVLVGDGLRLKQILINLIGNAIKFTESGFVEVRMEKADDAQWKIVVRDSGIGIPAKALPYLFEEFRQVDNSLERVYEGTGLGLSIVRKLVLRMSGTVEVESEVGKGSVFTVRLPLIPNTVERSET